MFPHQTEKNHTHTHRHTHTLGHAHVSLPMGPDSALSQGTQQFSSNFKNNSNVWMVIIFLSIVCPWFGKCTHTTLTPEHTGTHRCPRVKHLCCQKYLQDSKNTAVLYSELNTIHLTKASRLQTVQNMIVIHRAKRYWRDRYLSSPLKSTGAVPPVRLSVVNCYIPEDKGRGRKQHNTPPALTTLRTWRCRSGPSGAVGGQEHGWCGPHPGPGPGPASHICTAKESIPPLVMTRPLREMA